MEWNGEERRQSIYLTDEQIELIAERAAKRALQSVYAEIGKSVAKQILWVIGAAALAVLAWMKGKGMT